MSEPGPEIKEAVIDESSRRLVREWKQIGWQGQSGAFYALTDDARPHDHELGSFAPIYVLVNSADDP